MATGTKLSLFAWEKSCTIWLSLQNSSMKCPAQAIMTCPGWQEETTSHIYETFFSRFDTEVNPRESCTSPAPGKFQSVQIKPDPVLPSQRILISFVKKI